MKKALLSLCLVSCTSFAAEGLVPPTGASSDRVNRDMSGCVQSAVRAAAGEGEYLKGLDKELIQERHTSGFLFEVTLSGPKPIQPRSDGVLAPRESLFSGMGSTKRTDPYVACLLARGYRWENSKETGVESLQRLAGEGNARAQAELGRAYHEGIGVVRNNTRSFALASAAAAAKDPEALYLLAALYSEGDGVLPNDKMAAQLVKQAAEAGHKLAQRILPEAEQIAERSQKASVDLAAKLPDVRAAAESGDRDAQRKMGDYSIEGWGIPQDANAAIEWYKKAAQSGDAKAMTQIGVLYDKGRGVKVDYAAAVGWYKAAAEKGDAQGQFNFGMLTHYGAGTEKNEELGLEWIRRAADQKYELAVRALQALK
jgi:uncharacterized protein